MKRLYFFLQSSKIIPCRYSATLQNFDVPITFDISIVLSYIDTYVTISILDY